MFWRKFYFGIAVLMGMLWLSCGVMGIIEFIFGRCYENNIIGFFAFIIMFMGVPLAFISWAYFEILEPVFEKRDDEQENNDDGTTKE